MPGETRKKISIFAWFPILVAVLVFLTDQATKFFIIRSLGFSESIPILKNIFHLTLVHNYGAAFGMLKYKLPVLVLASLVAAFLIGLHFKKNFKNPLTLNDIALSLILGGALGNLLDRLRLGYVVDFLDFRIWPVFNVADSAITIGAIIIAWRVLLCGQKSARSAR